MLADTSTATATTPSAITMRRGPQRCSEIGRRSGYYPSASGREDALVMAMELVDTQRPLPPI